MPPQDSRALPGLDTTTGARDLMAAGAVSCTFVVHEFRRTQRVVLKLPVPTTCAEHGCGLLSHALRCSRRDVLSCGGR